MALEFNKIHRLYKRNETWRTLIILKIGHDCMTELKKDIDRTNNLYPPERLIASMLMFLLIVLFFYVALRHPEMIGI